MQANKSIQNLMKLKSNIENNQLSDNLLVFIDSEPFITDQYINAIKNQKKLVLSKVDNLDSLLQDSDIFNIKDNSNLLRILTLNDFKCNDKKLLSEENLIIVCKSITDTETKELFEDIIIEFPKLENWAIKDYVYSNSSISNQAKDWLISICNNNIYRLKQELDKLNIFEEKDQEELFKQFLHDDIFSDLSSYNIFDFTNSIIQKDIKKLVVILSERQNIDIEPLGVVTLLYNNLKKIISIQFKNNPTAQDCGLTDKQFYAIKKTLVNKLSNSKLLEAFKFVVSLDSKMKSGYISNDELIDYILVNIL